MKCTSASRLWLTIGCVFTLSCSDSAAPRVERWPSEGWQEGTPESQGMSSADLARLVEHFAESAHAMVVVRHGVLVLNARFHPYDGAAPHDLASVTKALTSLAVGVILDDHRELSVQTSLRTWFEAASERLTLGDALTMRAGFDCVSAPYERTLLEMKQTSDWTAFTLALPVVDVPGTVYRYCSPVAHLLSAVVSAAQRRDVYTLLAERVFEPLGIRDVTWPRDAQGNAHGWGDARMHATDLAKLGLLLLHRGSWAGERVLPAAWIDEATRAQGRSAEGEEFGFMFRPVEGGFVASGRGGQFLYVLPALDLVVVTQAAASPEREAAYGALARDELLPAVRSWDAIAEDAAGQELLRAALRNVAEPPLRTASTVPERWPAARYEFEPNPLGWQSFMVGAGGAQLTLTVHGREQTLAVGLDGVPRVTEPVLWSATTPSRVALSGEWRTPTQWLLRYDTLEGIDAGEVVFDFTAGAVEVRFSERTFLHGTLTLHAHSRA